MLSKKVKDTELPPRNRAPWSKFHEDMEAAEPGIVYRYTYEDSEVSIGVRHQLLYAAHQVGRKIETRTGDGCTYWQVKPVKVKAAGSGQPPRKAPARRQPPTRRSRGTSTSRGKAKVRSGQ
jgi:hypothetical protein